MLQGDQGRQQEREQAVNLGLEEKDDIDDFQYVALL